MDLPKKKWYGLRCPFCPATIWKQSQTVIELLCTVSFKDKGLPYIEDHFGVIVGYGNFHHTCRPDLDYDN